MRLPIKTKILLASAVTLGLVAWLIVFVLRAQDSLAAQMDEMVRTNMAAMRVAEQIKYTFVLYDDLVFRYLATEDKLLLTESRRVREKVHGWIEQAQATARGETEKELLAELKVETVRYDEDVETLLATHAFKTAEQKASVVELVKAMETGGAAVAPVGPTRRQKMALLSAEGRARLTRIYSLCEKLSDIARAKLEEAQNRVRDTVEGTARTILLSAAGVLAATGLVSLTLALSLLTPLKNLLKGVQKVTAGELNLEIPVEGSDEIGRLTHEFNTMTKNLKEKQERLVTETITDSLTELHNFRYFQTFLKSEISRSMRHQHPFAMLIIDIDHFKKFNDTNGHQMGNVILKQVAATLRETLRAEDFIARYGGEEFVVVLAEADMANVKRAAERLRQAVEQSDFPGRQSQPGGKVTVSIGGAAFPSDGTVASQLIEKADKALYAAKAAGRNNVKWAVETTG